MTERYSVHRRGPDHIDDLYAMIEVCGEDMWQRLGLDHWKPPTPKDMYREYARTKEVYAVQDGDTLVATFTIGIDPTESYPPGSWANDAHSAYYVNKLAVRPDLQQQGLGRWCMDEIERRARAYGYDSVRFDALTRNVQLLGFYDHIGYARCGDMYVFDEIGRGWDIVLYEKLV
jgi:GNAT superfamily N-acetyltransferase